MEFIFYTIVGIFIIWFLGTSILPARGVNHISAGELKPLIKNKNYQLVDVRTPYEFNSNHIKGFKNIPVSQMKEQQANLDKSKEIVLLCQSGMRSNKAARKFKKWGFEKVTNVKGGIVTWRH